MDPTNRNDQRAFENEVRRVARELWPEAQYGGAQLFDGSERDGVFETEDCVHIMEATVSRSKEKAQHDIGKMVSMANRVRPRVQHRAIKCWFVTLDEPTADQRTVANKHRDLVNALSFSQLQSKLIDVGTYLNARENYPFGSVRDPATGNPRSEVDYVPLELTRPGDDRLWSVAAITAALLEGKKFVVLGDYGAGKSVTLREIHKSLRRAYFNQQTTKFPLYLNLRDHVGQVNPAEVLDRHARNVGFLHGPHLVRAWRAGYVILLIDGFDELPTLGIQGLWKPLQESRSRAMQAVREFVRDQPAECGLALAGREHFFDTAKERMAALGTSAGFQELKLNEFTSAQVQQYLSKRGLTGRVPGWMPVRPLLVGYLAASGLLDIVLDQETLSGDPAQAWDLMLDKVCEREAQIEAGIDGPTVRRILERLATVARTTSGGLLSREQVFSAFAEICGYPPDEKGMMLLQRLPGLGIDRAEEATRVFIDDDLADACRAGDVLRFINDPYGVGPELPKGAEVGMGALGVGLVATKAEALGVEAGKLNTAIRRGAESEDLAFINLDVARVALELGCSIDVAVEFKDIYIPTLELSGGINDCSQLRFRDCYFSKIGLDPDLNVAYLPRFRSCYIDEVDGRSSRDDLPKDIFDAGCQFETFSDAPENTDAISAMDLPLGDRVLLTILKKVYLQSGHGRRENALHRGLDHHGRRLVTPILHLLQSKGLVSPYRRGKLDMTIWVPDRTQTSRVAKMITSPRTCGDTLIDEAATVS